MLDDKVPRQEQITFTELCGPAGGLHLAAGGRPPRSLDTIAQPAEVQQLAPTCLQHLPAASQPSGDNPGGVSLVPEPLTGAL